MNLEFPRQIFRKTLKCKFPWKSALWESSCSMWTDRHDEAISWFSQFFRTRLKSHCPVLCQMDSKVLMKIPHCDIHTDLTDCDWFMFLERPVRVDVSFWVRESPIGLYKKLCEPWFRVLLMSSGGPYTPSPPPSGQILGATWSQRGPRWHSG
jgi:hypothetical protein